MGGIPRSPAGAEDGLAIDYDIAIVGTGLAGLSAALAARDKRPDARILLLERAGRSGGRVMTTSHAPQRDGAVGADSTAEASELQAEADSWRRFARSASGATDLGGAWIWPEAMPTMVDLVKRLGQDLERQEGAPGFRVRGGVPALLVKLWKELCGNGDREGITLLYNAKVEHVAEEPDRVVLRILAADLQAPPSSDTSKLWLKGAGCWKQGRPLSVRARHVLLALPPAKIMQDIKLTGEQVHHYLTGQMRRQMAQQPIWMAPAGKLALGYPEKFWSVGQLASAADFPPFGDASGSAGGRAFQFYDAGKDGALHMVVAFVSCGQGAENPYGAEAMADIVVGQLAQTGHADLFRRYESAELKCWKTDLHVNVSGDAAAFPRQPRPIPGINAEAPGHRRRIWFAGSEAAERMPGFLEGAASNGRATALRALAAMAGR